VRPVLAITLSILLTLSPVTAWADISFAGLARLASSPDQLQGRFRQEKYLGALDTSLLSSGRFSYRRGESIRWEILEPIQNELVITPSGLSSRQGDNELLRIDARSNPGAAILGEIMFAVLSADWSRLEQYFELSGDIDGQQWRALLQPRDAVIGQVINQVELRGADLLRVIVLHEHGGDRTTIHLDVPEG
jgi:hypothetical protein